MKRSLLIALILAAFFTGLAGQDRIITTGNDTIDCRITRITRNTIYFDTSVRGIRTSGRVPMTNVYSYYILPSGTGEQVKRDEAVTTAGRLRIGINGGLAYLTASSDKAEEALTGLGVTPARAKAYYKDLKTGWYGSTDVSWIFNRNYGIGLKYKFFNTGAATEGYFDPGDPFNIYYTTYTENIYVNYGGVLLSYYEPLGSQNLLTLYSSFSAGIAFYRDETGVFSEAVLITGKALGMDCAFGLDYRITPFISAGAELSFFASTLRSITFTDGETEQSQELDKENYENLSRIEVSIGLRFYLWNK
ncbi:MAG: hypothetical protein QUS66_11810 [Bacteroidota bacterium]|nr:hypothetical protein [Bacteroidota bacterium]